MVAGRKQQAIDLINTLIKEQETPRLWCCLGDLEGKGGWFSETSEDSFVPQWNFCQKLLELKARKRGDVV